VTKPEQSCGEAHAARASSASQRAVCQPLMQSILMDQPISVSVECDHPEVKQIVCNGDEIL
jgi:hypothetical protein